MLFEHSKERNASGHRKDRGADEDEGNRFRIRLINLDIGVIAGQEHQEYKAQLVEDIEDFAFFRISEKHLLRQSWKQQEQARTSEYHAA